MESRKRMVSLLAGASMFVLSAAAHAQDAPKPAQPNEAADDTQNAPGVNGPDRSGASAAAAPGASTPSTEAAGDIVVTGSRVIQNGNQSPTPVTTVTTQRLQEIRPTTIADGLNMLPVFSGSRSPTNSGGATGGVGGGNPVSNQLNLRNVGPTRNLILMDGRRVPPTTNTNAVDVDMIPQMLIQRVDVVTGGVSAVYGSDAISGVVNFITDKTLKGIRMQASSGISQYGDNANYDLGIAAGQSFAGGRGHFEASYEFRDNKGILYRSDRDWYRQAVVVGSGTAAVPYQVVTGARNPAQPFGGRITCGGACSINGQYFAADGVLSPFVNGTTTASGLQIGGAGGYHDASLIAPIKSHQFFGRVDYDVTDNIHFYAYGSGNLKTNAAYATWMILTAGTTLSATNPYLAPQYQAALAAAGQTSFGFQRTLNENDRLGFTAKSDQYVGVAGLSGDIAGGFKWNAAYNYGSSKLNTTILNNVNQQNLAAALNSTINPATGQIVCAASLTNSAFANCVPFNPFGPSATSAQSLSYVLANTGYHALTQLHDVTGDISGSPFSTWAGAVQVALSGEWRQLSFHSTSDALPSQYANCTGITYNCTSSTLLWQQTFAARSPVHQSVAEGAVEVEVPLLKDVRFAKSLSLNGAGRFTDYYNTVGKYWTWKGGATWEVSDELRLRGTISRDIRAPTLNDLYAPPAVVVSNSGFDIKTQTSPNVPQVTSGNPSLTAEVGHTKTVGVVFKPGFLRNFSVAIDYFNINITNAIVLIPGFTQSYQQSCIASGGSSPYCALQHRDAAGNITQWDVQPINIGQLKTYGIDGEANYVGRVLDRAFSLRALVSWQPHIRYIQPAVTTVDQGGVAFGSVGITAAPKWRVTVMGSDNVTPEFRVDVQERWRSHLKQWGDPTALFASGSNIPSYALTTLNLSYTVPKGNGFGRFEFYGNIQNLFNIHPQPGGPPASATSTPGSNNGFSTFDDVVGRYFTFGVRVAI